MGKSATDSIAAKSLTARRQRGSVPSAELVPLQFRMPPEFVKAYKQAALDRDMKLNELLEHVFNEFLKTGD
jgi:hypothetical protein